MSAAITSTRPRTQLRRREWALIAAAMACCGWGGNQFTPLLLMYRKLGGYSEVTVDMFLGAYVVGLAPALLVTGALSDRYGRRPVMVAGTWLSLLSSVVLALGADGPIPLYAGRFLAGVATGVAMAVGSSWVKELSQAPYDPRSDAGAGARRASLSLTVGFGVGAGLAGALAQWGPWPMVLPYLPHVVLTLPVALLLPRRAETRPMETDPGTSLLSSLKIPAAAHRRFLRVVLPMAPWIFGSAAVAYAVMPQVVSARTGTWGLAFATLATVCTLSAGVLVQPLARRLDSISTARATVFAMGLVTAGMVLCAAVAATQSVWLALAGGIVLGAAYGVAIVSGLLEIQRIAAARGNDDLASLTGVYYAVSYTGFLFPSILAALSKLTSYTVLLVAVALIALLCTLVVQSGSRRHLPSS